MLRFKGIYGPFSGRKRCRFDRPGDGKNWQIIAKNQQFSID
jgi:hypothetical protein